MQMRTLEKTLASKEWFAMRATFSRAMLVKRALEIGYHACVWQWEWEASVEEIQQFIADARALLDSGGLREADRWRLCALLLQAADYWNGLTAESVA